MSGTAREPLFKSWAEALCVSLGVLILDHLTKFIVQKSMFLGESVEILGGFFRLTYIYNPGGVFGMRYGGDLFYILLSAVAIVFIVYYYVSHHRDRRLRLPLALVIGGAVGNLIDRLRYGKVLDFLDFDIPDINIPDFTIASIRFPGLRLERWPVFNIADSAITVGVLMIMLLLVIQPGGKIQNREATEDINS